MTLSAPGRRGASDQRAIRRANLSAVVRLLTAGGPRSRSTIAVETGFNKSTVSSLVGELIDVGLLTETGEDEHPGRVGRPARTVRLAGDGVVAVGLEVNVDHLAVCTVDLSGLVRRSDRVDADNTARSPAQVLDALAALAETAIREAEEEGAMVVGAAIGLPGLVDQRRRRLIVAPNLGWHDVPVADELATRLGRQQLLIAVDNEANLAALAEHRDGAARDIDDVIFVSGDVGIGAGVLIGGELHRGSHGFAGELGHVAIDPAGERCACGSRGCLETIAGQSALQRRAGVRAAGPHAGVAELVGRAQAGDARTLSALAEAGHADRRRALRGGQPARPRCRRAGRGVRSAHALARRAGRGAARATCPGLGLDRLRDPRRGARRRRHDAWCRRHRARRRDRRSGARRRNRPTGWAGPLLCVGRPIVAAA